jgi:hypothetical protein
MSLVSAGFLCTSQLSVCRRASTGEHAAILQVFSTNVVQELRSITVNITEMTTLSCVDAGRAHEAS